MSGMAGTLGENLFWLLLAVPLGIFAVVMLFGFWNAAESDHDGPEIDLDGEAGPPQ